MNIVKVDMTEGIVSKAPFPRPGRLDHMLGGRAVHRSIPDRPCFASRPSPSEEEPLHSRSGVSRRIVGSQREQALGGRRKSPLTGGIKEANVGGTAGSKLGRLAIQAIVVEGRASTMASFSSSIMRDRLEPARFRHGPRQLRSLRTSARALREKDRHTDHRSCGRETECELNRGGNRS